MRSARLPSELLGNLNTPDAARVAYSYGYLWALDVSVKLTLEAWLRNPWSPVEERGPYKAR